MEINSKLSAAVPPLLIRKNDSKYLSKLQIKRAQFLFENDYFIWNEAEMYLRYHEFFSNLPNSDILYENVCKTTRVVFNLIHDVHFSGIDSNAAHLKFYEVLDAWGALSLYIKEHDRFPQPFIEWFDSIFQIYQTKNEYDEKVASFECLLRLFIISGADDQMAVESYNTVTAKNTIKLTFERIVQLLKYIVNNNELKHFSNALVPKLQNYLLSDTTEKPPEQVLRNYDYEMNNLYSTLSDWRTTLNVMNEKRESKPNDYYVIYDQTKENKTQENTIYTPTPQEPLESKSKEKYSSDYYSKTNISDIYAQYNVPNTQTISTANSFNTYDYDDSEKIYSNPSISIYDSTNNQNRALTKSAEQSVKLNKEPEAKKEPEKKGFKLSEFKKEFKRNEISRSINTLDLLGTSLIRDKSNTSLSHSDFRQGFSSSSSNLKQTCSETCSKSMSKLSSKSRKSFKITNIDLSDSLNSSETENISLYINTSSKASGGGGTKTTSNKKSNRNIIDFTLATNKEANEFLTYLAKTALLNKQQIVELNRSSLMRSETIRHDMRKEFKSKNSSQEESDNSNNFSSKTNRMLFQQQPKKKNFKKDLNIKSSSSSLISSSSEWNRTKNTVATSETKSEKSKLIQPTPSSLTGVTATTPTNTGNTQTQSNSSSTVSPSNTQIEEGTTKQTTEISTDKTNTLSSSSKNLPSTIVKLNLRSLHLNKEFKQPNRPNPSDTRIRSSTPKLLQENFKYLDKSHSWLTNIPSEKKKKSSQTFLNSIAPNTKDLLSKRYKFISKTYDFDDAETKSEKYVSRRAKDSKATHSYGLSEPIKSIANAITLSSLDTLNDIDSEEEDDDNDEEDNLSLEDDNQEENDANNEEIDEDDDEDETSDDFEEEDEDEEEEEEEEPIKINRSKFGEYSFIDNQFNKLSLLDQDWSYSQNSNTFTFSASDQKIIAHVIRKLKPYIAKCVKKEVRKYFEKKKFKTPSTTTASQSQNKYENTSLTKIGDF